MTETTGTTKFRYLESILEPRARWLLIISVLFPAAILLFYYNQNATYVPIKYVLITSALCMIITAVFWFLAVRILRHVLAASVFCLMMWIGVFFASLAHAMIGTFLGHIGVFYFFWMLISAGLVFILRKTRTKGTVSFILCAFITVFFLMSAVSAVFVMLFGFSAKKPEMKTEFFVESTVSPQPNVYWIHCDGMLSFSVIDKYFGDSQDEFREELRKRGFDVNETANFEANHDTTVAVPALLCPFFYDTYLSDVINDPESDHRALAKKTQSVLKEVRLNNETINAFTAAGYDTNTVALMDQFFFPTTDSFYFPLDTVGCGHFTRCIYLKYPYKLAKLPRLSQEEAIECINIAEANTFMLSFFRPGVTLFGFDTTSPEAVFSSYSSSAELVGPVISDEKMSEIFLGGDASVSHAYFAQALAHILNAPPKDKPQFNMFMSLMFHDPYIFDENGNYLESFLLEDATNYHGQHVYAAKVLINMVDMILEKDPDAVIILQADHGMNAHEEWELDLSFGEGHYDLLELRNATMSAIRVPEKYRNGEEEFAMRTPLNISRYIVNNFVGRNYEYIEEDPPRITSSDT
ncbi:MAG: hypothetical protein JW780_05745 [Clostridiales bacterium]|nr:hypothetical protein [Clostridiales bacterium]